MSFATKREVLEWYERQPRALTKEFIGRLKWSEVKNYELDRRFVPVLLYMRDVEVLTDMYYAELRRTPTAKDPFIGKFMERWSVEETTHGELLNRFLNEAGVETPAQWQTDVRRAVSPLYTANAYLVSFLTRLVGRRFTATHMTFGAIHEMTTGQAYRRLMKLAGHPVLTEILTAIMREESAHTKFYLSVARIELERCAVARRAARFFVNRFWRPVGTGAKRRRETENTIAALFGSPEGVAWIDRNVTQKVQNLPGFAGWTKVTDTIAKAVS